jgi:hypothetical protein
MKPILYILREKSNRKISCIPAVMRCHRRQTLAPQNLENLSSITVFFRKSLGLAGVAGFENLFSKFCLRTVSAFQ